MSRTLGDLQAATFARASASTAASYPPEDRLSPGQLASYLDSREFAILGSTRPDGRPHAVLTSFARSGTDFWLPVGARSVRERNIRTQPWATLVVTEGDHGRHIAVIIEGPAEPVALGDAPDDVRSKIAGDWVALWFRLRAERVISYGAKNVPA